MAFGTFGTILDDYLEQPWERARGLLRDELDQLKTALRGQWGSVFSTTGNNITINSTSVTSESISAAASDDVEDLDGTADPGDVDEYSRGNHKHYDRNRPTDGQKDALVGTSGTPSTTNPYVTDQDVRLVNGANSAGTIFLLMGA